MTLDDADFGPLTFDAGLGAWTGRLHLPPLEGCRETWHLSLRGELDEYEGEPPSDGVVEMVVAEGNGEGGSPGPSQRAALAFLRANEGRVCERVLAEIARYARQYYLTPDQIPADSPALTSHRAVADRLCTVVGVRDWLSPSSAHFHYTGEDGCCYVSFDFHAGFDDEHGVAVLMLRDRVVDSNGSGEFYDR